MSVLRIDPCDFDDTELGAEVRSALARGLVVVGPEIAVEVVAHRCEPLKAVPDDCVACGDDVVVAGDDHAA